MGPVEKISLETQQFKWSVLSTGNCGILVKPLIGRHEREYHENQRLGLAFAHHVIQQLDGDPSSERLSTPQLLLDAADAVITDPDFMFLLMTTWRYVPEGVEICSVGANTVLVFEQDTIEEVIVPHTALEWLKQQGQSIHAPLFANPVTHMLGSRKSQKSCRIEDIRVALVPLLPTTTIAIIAEQLLVEAIQEQRIPRNELSSFIETWSPPGRMRTTSVLISW
ncbi:hypothetical protein KSX_68410 [Ktedonospora formicarum]|uniref:Uncharacterized protein n=1 Tax=Ktedonospora formicarum TaxID=2778364 RepID=A0A8J3IAF9_9CHLR|nr:hypothetical protein KSX_68410 [Ktedonospora formicarum]